MTTLKHAESRRMYSWWWDSHISPKNSKWLKENLTDMDSKIKSMIKLIEEDADSFARRAEMYYKKRPELMKLVEEFYRAYRALAERYDHATGALRQAHRTMSEAFPNQIPLLLSDESEETDEITSKKGLKKLDQTIVNFSEGNMLKSEVLLDEESMAHKVLWDLQNDDSGDEDGADQIKKLEDELSHLSEENRNFMNQIASESERADRAERELQNLKESFSKVVSEQENTLLQYQTSLERLSNLEDKISRTHEELKKQNNDILEDLERQILLINEENGSLNNQKLSSDLMLQNLQNVIGLNEEEKKILHQEISFLQEHKNDCERKLEGLSRQTDAASSNLDSLQALVKDLQDGNLELKEICKKQEDEKALHLQNMEKISEKNVVLENSLCDTSTELEGLREKITILEASCESLHGKISFHMSEKAVLVSQIDVIAQNMDKLTDKNNLLENSLSDINVELETSRQKLKGLEDSFIHLSDQKSYLLTEKNALVSQVESINQILENMEKRYSDLESKHANLERENDSTHRQVLELQNLLNLEKQDHETLVQSTNCTLINLENQIYLLHQEGQVREERFEMDQQQKAVNAQIENYILQRCIAEIKDKNILLSIECWKLREKSKYAEEEISTLEDEHFLLQEKIAMLLEQNEKLRKGFGLITEALNLNKDAGYLDDDKDESILHLILCEIKGLMDTISRSEKEKQRLLLENSVILTILKQFGVDIADLYLEKHVLEQESRIKSEELVILQSKKTELSKMNEQHMMDLYSRCQNEKALKSEKDILSASLTHIQGSYQSLLEENILLSKKYHDTNGVKEVLEQENSHFFAEAISLENLYLIFKSYSAERALDVKSLAHELSCLRKVKDNIDIRVEQMNGRTEALVIENAHLKDLIITLEDNLRKASLEIESKDGLLLQKDMELSRAHKMYGFLEEKNKLLQKEVTELRTREEELTFEIERGAYDLLKCELEFSALLHDIQIAVVHSAIFEDKVVELMAACNSLEISSLVQKEMLLDEIASRNSYVGELENMLYTLEEEHRRLKMDMNAYAPLIKSLRISITLLEESTLPLAKYPSSFSQDTQGNVISQELEAHNEAATLSGILELQKLISKVEALREMVANTGHFLEVERLISDANLVSAHKVIEDLRSKELPMQEKPEGYGNMQEDYSQSFQSENGDRMKDIPLVHVRTSPHRSSNVNSAFQDGGSDDQILALWETAKAHDQFEVLRDGRNKHPSSEIFLEEELGVGSNRSGEPSHDWNKRVLERLASDAGKLTLLQLDTEELKRKVESSEMNDTTSVEFLTIKAQIKDTEAAIAQLTDFNNRLTKKADDLSDTAQDYLGEFDRRDIGNKSRRKILISARKESERIGRLELELQKLEYILLKLEEEYKFSKARASDKRRRARLRDYIYGHKVSGKSRKARFCACMRPSTKHD